jgi:hypothetical protein
MLYGGVYLSRSLSRARGTIAAPVTAHYRFCLAFDTEGPTTTLVDSLLIFPQNQSPVQCTITLGCMNLL